MTRFTVPWTPWLEGTPPNEFPGEVIVMLYVIAKVVGDRPGIMGRAAAARAAGIVGVDVDCAEWYVELALELGMLGGVCAVTGEDVQIEYEPAGPDRGAN